MKPQQASTRMLDLEKSLVQLAEEKHLKEMELLVLQIANEQRKSDLLEQQVLNAKLESDVLKRKQK